MQKQGAAGPPPGLMQRPFVPASAQSLSLVHPPAVGVRAGAITGRCRRGALGVARAMIEGHTASTALGVGVDRGVCIRLRRGIACEVAALAAELAHAAYAARPGLPPQLPGA